MNAKRRQILAAGTAASALALVPPALHAEVKNQTPKFDPMPALPKVKTPGKPGDFSFLEGEWKLAQKRLKGPADWDIFEGAATVRSILGGVVSVEELRIPARDFSGMGLRSLDLEKKVWHDVWMNGKSGVVVGPGVPGSFEDGVGIFVSEEEEKGVKVLVAGVWDNISKTTCRWRQAASKDDGKTWDQNWIMDWTRVR
jgi:hypothetical protein